MPTVNGLAILESIKAKHFPDGYQAHTQSGKDYRFSRKGQAEFKRAARLQMARLSSAALGKSS
ncbi:MULTISPECIES: hypothetical protein [Vibrio]|uniref:hypothetical protein n=1 Tax=Vibrio TaxID=662 RepID=UPI000390B721|nr:MULTISPECIES: hypothetical protein [Vibrio]ERB62593.1 hypothetical protein N779_25435 [Vibrio coralliilyticus OCN008]NOI59298.1 hypothetical protein [Vibrio coralliilyticus]PAT66160.1 hypothetical protein CKA27_21230 [Vibrio coralliilyticus]PAU36523.1 hypothetical protein CKF94_19930 [Vibrio coralliilyticus]QFT37637.1 hypothetical protein FIU99_14545 [Vibrio sp. THAF64]